MKFLSRTAIRNIVFVGGALMLSTAYLIFDGYSYPFGQAGVAKNSGCSCHGVPPEPNTNTTVTVSSEATEFVAGQTYLFSIEVRNATAEAAGFNVSISRSSSGRIDTVGTGTKTSSQRRELVQTVPLDMVEGAAKWWFKYTVPTAANQLDTIWVVGNAVDGSGSADGGDEWNFAPLFILTTQPTGSVSKASDIAESFTLGPNPSRNASKLFFNLKRQASLRVSLMDVTGREVYLKHVENANPGRGEAMIDMDQLPAGDYFVHVTSGGALLYTGKISRIK